MTITTDGAGGPSLYQARTQLNLEKLPGIPKIWLDFLHSRLPTQPASGRITELYALAEILRPQPARREELCRLLENAKDPCSDQTLENIQRLRQPGSVAVVASLWPALFGGPEFQVLKCLTAIKVCAHLEQHKLAAVPVCWIHAAAPGDFPMDSIQLLDAESEMHCLRLQKSGAGDFSAFDILPGDQVASMLSQINELGRGTYDPEILEILEASFCSGATLAQASARLMAALMAEWGLLVVNSAAPDFQSLLREVRTASSGNPLPVSVVQSILLPVAACVVDPCEIRTYLDVQPELDALKLPRPMAWPQSSATFMDVRSRKILERYGLDLYQLYSGKEMIIRGFVDAMPREASARLLELKREAQDRVDSLRTLGSAGDKFGKAASSAREKITFQLNRLQEHFDAARTKKQEIVTRHIHRACNLLTPNGQMQERELSGIQLPLRYSRAVLRSLYAKLDVLSTEHQLISMD